MRVRAGGLHVRFRGHCFGDFAPLLGFNIVI